MPNQLIFDQLLSPVYKSIILRIEYLRGVANAPKIEVKDGRSKMLTKFTLQCRLVWLAVGNRTPNLLIKRQPSFFHSLSLTPFFPYLYTNSGVLLSLKG